MKTTEGIFVVVFGIFLIGCGPREQKRDVVIEPPAFKRYCLTLDLKDNADLIKEYRYWHDGNHIWPEIPRGIREVGIIDMEIYLLGSRLFMIMETKPDFDFDKQMAKLAELPRQKEWEAFVSKYQKSSPDAKSSEKWRIMERIFKLPGADSLSVVPLDSRPKS